MHAEPQPRGLVGGYPTLVAGLVLTGLFLWSYFSMPALPGQSTVFPLGWWGWFDQGKYLESARGLAAHDLAGGRHWYPMGYAVLGAPFVEWGFAGHPFVLVDLGCLLLTLWGFTVFARGVGVSGVVAAVVFVGSVAWDRQMFGEWAIPWNSTPAAAGMWGVLALCGLWLGGRRYPLLLGAVGAAVPLFRPTEGPAVAVAVGWLLVAEWRGGAVGAAGLVVAGGRGGGGVVAGIGVACGDLWAAAERVYAAQPGFGVHAAGLWVEGLCFAGGPLLVVFGGAGIVRAGALGGVGVCRVGAGVGDGAGSGGVGGGFDRALGFVCELHRPAADRHLAI